MSKFKLYYENEKHSAYIFYCPGCDCGHGVRFKGEGAWEVSGIEEDKPTVSPSVLATGRLRCHSMIKDGMIQYLPDTEHQFAGQTIEIPECPY